ncbi:DUF4998 domain-containing protein [Parabacteroides pacaensis]|uniref:DUF4998 domain-containing protein n=1 Tax=Parabacteroides pacaensis TaxID=2086575 RepID=UPI000D1058A5|nr:DUF4998 domain-containing protein [Parabacteroides pacaensis]
MKKSIYFIVGWFTFIAMYSCSDMNDMHDPWMKDGEITYVGRVDSIHAYSGRERVLVSYWVTDPRVKKLIVYWNQKADSVIVPVTPHHPSDSLTVMIGEGETKIKEGDHTFFFYSYDERGHRSVKYETLLNVYGDRYQATLSNRSIKKVNCRENTLILEWGGSNSNNEIGIEILYTDKEGKTKTFFAETALLAQAIVLENVDITKEVKYRTLFKPNPQALDTFSAPEIVIPINNE